MFFRVLLVLMFAMGVSACGSSSTRDRYCGQTSDWLRVELEKNAGMTDAEFFEGASVGGVSADNRRTVTFMTEMPLCVCSEEPVEVRGRTVKADPGADVTVSVGLVSAAESTVIDVEGPTDQGEFTWSKYVVLRTKGHGALAYSFSVLITYSFPSVGDSHEDGAELRRIISELSCTGRYYRFTNDPCSDPY